MKVRSLWKQHRVAVIAVAAAVLLLGSALGWLTLGDGGPPPDRSSGGKMYTPVVQSWHLYQGDMTLCDDENACMRDVLVKASQSGDCTWSGRVWLASGGNPFYLHSLSTEGYAVIQTTRTGGPTMSFDYNIGDAWWRSIAKHTDVSLTIPCDTKIIALTFNLQGKTLMGRSESGVQSADIVLHDEPWDSPAN